MGRLENSGFVRRWAIEPLIGFVQKRPGWAFLGVLAYLIFPVDLIPESFTGLLGYLDDVLLLVFYNWLRKQVRLRTRPLSKVVDTTATFEK